MLKIQPENVAALNNLAYALAVQRKAVQDALPLAEKAYALAGSNAKITDTLAFIVHLSGDDLRAKRLILQAIQTGPQIPMVRLHAAMVLAALNEKDAAQQELGKALELDPKLAADEEVQQLGTRLQH